uniref:Uncharacterized protein n=1 Tax=Musa acuminata TaxID=4641 RepID=Q1EPA0_MUSAC|nr:hypothetical protein MA4_54N07.44 [Musa acuminata]
MGLADHGLGVSGSCKKLDPPLHRGERNHGCQGFAQREREGREGVQGFGGGVVGGQVREGVEHLGDEEGQGDHPLRLHPPHHRHRYELRAQTPALSAPQPRLTSPPRTSASFALRAYRIVHPFLLMWYIGTFDLDLMVQSSVLLH